MKQFFAALLISLAATVWAQEPLPAEKPAAEQNQNSVQKPILPEKSEPVISENSDAALSHGFYGAVVTKGSQIISDKFGLFLGARAAYILDHRFSIGATFSWLSHEVVPESDPYLKGFSFGYGGLYLEYIQPVWRFISLSAGCMIGLGSFRVEYVSDTMSQYEDRIMVFEPELHGLFTITDFFQIDLGIGYRLAALKSYQHISYSELFGVTGGISLRFGMF